MRTRKGFTLRPLGKEYILVAEGLEIADYSQMVSMNGTAAFLWQEVEDKDFNADTLAELLVDHWHIAEETAKKDVEAILESWKKANIVE